MLISKTGRVAHVTAGSISSLGTIISTERTDDGIYFYRDYCIEFGVESSDGVLCRPPIKIIAQGVELLDGIAAAVNFAVQSEYMTPEAADMYNLRQLCQQFFAIHATMKAQGTSRRTCEELTKSCTPELVDFVRKSLKNPSQAQFVWKMVTAYMWMVFCDMDDCQNMIVRSRPGFDADEISAMIADGRWKQFDGYGRAFETPESFARVMQKGLLAHSLSHD